MSFSGRGLGNFRNADREEGSGKRVCFLGFAAAAASVVLGERCPQRQFLDITRLHRNMISERGKAGRGLYVYPNTLPETEAAGAIL